MARSGLFFRARARLSFNPPSIQTNTNKMPFELLEAPARLTTVNQAEPILRLTRAITPSPSPTLVTVPLSTGDVFHANGKIMRIPRGEVDASFVRKVGTVNRTLVEPVVPARVPLRSVRVPKGVGAIVVIDWATFCAEQIGTQLAPLVDAYSDGLTRLTIKQDLELAEQTMALTQFKPQEAAQRLRAASMTRTKTARSAARKVTTIRAFSRS